MSPLSFSDKRLKYICDNTAFIFSLLFFFKGAFEKEVSCVIIPHTKLLFPSTILGPTTLSTSKRQLYISSPGLFSGLNNGYAIPLL